MASKFHPAVSALVAGFTVVACGGGSGFTPLPGPRPDPDPPNAKFALYAAPAADGLLLVDTRGQSISARYQPAFDVFLLERGRRETVAVNRLVADGARTVEAPPLVTSDGLRAVFAVSEGAPGGLYLFDRASGQVAPVAVPDEPHRIFRNPQMAADAVVAWVGESTGDAGPARRPYLARLDGSLPPVPLASPAAPDAQAGAFALGPGGGELVWYERNDDAARIVRAPIGSTAASVLVEFGGPAMVWELKYAGLGRVIYRTDDGAGLGIFSLATDGSAAPTRLDPPAPAGAHPLEPEVVGDLVAYWLEDDTGRRLMIVDPGSPGVARAAGPPSADAYRVGADGGHAAVSAGDGTAVRLHLIDLRDDPPTSVVVAENLSADDAFAFDDDGGGLVFIDSHRLVRVPLDQPDQTTVLGIIPQDLAPAGLEVVAGLQRTLFRSGGRLWLGPLRATGAPAPVVDVPPFTPWFERAFSPLP